MSRRNASNKSGFCECYLEFPRNEPFRTRAERDDGFLRGHLGKRHVELGGGKDAFLHGDKAVFVRVLDILGPRGVSPHVVKPVLPLRNLLDALEHHDRKLAVGGLHGSEPRGVGLDASVLHLPTGVRENPDLDQPIADTRTRSSSVSRNEKEG